MKRRTVHKITPSRPSTFDQQFWPVLVALTVLSGIALGAVLTILRGPWMWGSLLVLPLLAAVAIFLLFNLDDNRLRRSLQFAIITSLAAHMMILVFASVINIFQNPYKPNERQVARQRPIRTIEISDQRASFVWEETNSRQTPEPTVETERQKKPTTNVQPQPVPVVESKPEINPQLVRRETPAQSVPRQNRELSELKRQTRNLQPQSSQQTTGQKVAENKTSPAASNVEKKIESSKQADTVARQSTAEQQSTSEPEKASAAPDSTNKKVARSSSSARRARPAETPEKSSPQPSPSNARVARRTPRMPVATKKAPTSEKVATATTTQPTPNSPSQSASKLTRRPVESRTTRPAFSNRPKTDLSPRPQIAKTVQRRTDVQTKPSISNPTSVTITPRRSTVESLIAATTIPVESPSRAPESKTSSRELKSKTLSVNRSTSGVAGVGRAKNLDRFIGGMNSPASRASDSARRERTQSSQADQRMLTSSQKSVARRSVGATRTPTSAFKSEMTAAAKISGAKIPGERTLESSAASIDAASTNFRDEVSAEKGNTTVDLGATKVVTDRQSQRRSGGGQQEVSLLNPESTRRSKDRSDQQPSIVASTGSNVTSPRNQSTAPPSTNALEASTKSAFAARAGGESETTVERWSSETAGQISDAGTTNVAQQLSDSREQARRTEEDGSWNDDEDEDEENKRGSERTRVAQAPVTRSDPGFGTARDGATSMAAADQSSDAPSESVSTMVTRQATTSIPGSGIGQAAANVLLQAATSLPIIEAAPNRRNGAGNSSRSDADLNAGLASNPKPRGSRTTKSNVAPTLSGNATTVSPNVSNRGSSDLAQLDSLPVNVSRSDLSTIEQIQGSELDIDAVEGPAGLGVRPDTYIGVMTRPSSRESEQLLPDMKNRFRSPNFGGSPSINPDAVMAQEAFRNRSPSALAKASEPTTEAAIHLGLEFLARYQLADGSWALTGFDRDEPQQLTQLDSDTAATGLALLAFQGAGYNHREFKYARQINHAIQWLIENQAPDGGLYVPSNKKSDNACRLYSHGIAALALTEAYGMTQDARLKEPAQKALDYIIESQDPRKGGWRYFDQPGKKSSDTSVSGWMMMAMQSGRLAGLDVDEESFASIGDWLDVAADPDDESLYRYNPYAVDSKGVSRIQGRKPTASMTSVGLLMRIYSGWKRNDPRLVAGAEYLLKTQLPSDSTPQLRDTYYWYYATQVLKYVDGEQWEKWNDRLRPLLTRSQEKSGDFAGSWHPYRPVPDRWGAFGGRLYVTTMNLLSLEVRHRMLPLYKQGQPETETPDETSTKRPEYADDGSMTEPVSTKASPIEPKAKPKPFTTPIVVSKASEPQPEIKPARKTEAKRTKLKKAETGRPTVVRKPVIQPPRDINNSRPLDASKNSLNKPARSAKRVPGIDSTPDLARSNRPANSNRTRPGLKPTTVPVDVPKLAANSKTELQPRNIESRPNRSRSIPEMRPATLPDEVEPRIGSENPLTKTKTEIPTVEIPESAKPKSTSPKTVKPKIEARPAVKFSSVTGLVTLDGNALKNAKIEFIPIDRNGNRISVRTDPFGRYVIGSSSPGRRTGVKVAKYKVSVTTFVESDDINVIDFLETVPAKYNSKTTLTATVSGKNANSFDFKLKSK